MAIVKADAYGLGAKSVVQATTDLVDYYGVANLEEALNVSRYTNNDILILGITDINNFIYLKDTNIHITVESYDMLKKIEQKHFDFKIKIHLKINTGLNRLGISDIDECKKCLTLIDQNDNIVLTGLFTHFATKQNDIDFINYQYNKFSEYKKLVNTNVIVHCANSFASLNLPYKESMIRCGFAMYGYGNDILKQTLQITSKIVCIKHIKKGESIGYDRSYVASDDMKIAVIPIGYADGLDRRLSNTGKVLCNNKYVPIIGYISMDQCMIDVSRINVNIGDNVVILGSMQDKNITLYDYAKLLNTSAYEILLNFDKTRMNYVLNY